MSAPARKLALVVGFALGGAAAFLLGRGIRHTGPLAPLFDRARPTQTAGAESAAHSEEAQREPGAPGPTPDFHRLGQALGSATRSHAAPGQKPEWFVETPAEREDRHRTIDRKITETLGDIPKEKRAALLELNDEATEVQLGLQGALMAGRLSQKDYDQQMHQRVMVQLDQLRGVLTDAQYRKMTGLEPGVDPYEYMRTGIGGANGRPEIETTTPPGAPPKDPDAP